MPPNKRVRKRPITAPSPSHSTRPTLSKEVSVSASLTRSTIRRFHLLLKEKSRLLSPRSSSSSSSSSTSHAVTKGSGAASTSTRLEEIEAEIEAMGGLEAYQAMSALGQSKERGGGSEKVLIGWLKELGLGPSSSASSSSSSNQRKAPLELLEVGALRPDNYAPHHHWIHCHPIDLHSRHPDIKEQDFLTMSIGENGERWDVVSLSLVLNFVPDARDRGRMLSLVHSFLRPQRASYLFLVLPLPCVLNSRFLTPEHLERLMEAVGFKLVKRRWRERGGKVAYWLWEKVGRERAEVGERAVGEGQDRGQGEDQDRGEERKRGAGGGGAGGGEFARKKVLREGKGRNNFAILWDGS